MKAPCRIPNIYKAYKMLPKSTADSDSQISWLYVFSKSQSMNTKIMKRWLCLNG